MVSNINAVHVLLTQLLQNTRAAGVHPNPVKDATQLDQILLQSQSLHDRLQKIEELLARPRTPIMEAQPEEGVTLKVAEADWPIASLSRDAINRQPRQQAIGDWNASTTSLHEVEGFQHRLESVPRFPAPEAVQQVLVQRYVPSSDDIYDAAESLHIGHFDGKPAFSRPLPRELETDADQDSQKSRFILLAVGFLLIFTLLLGA
jgi:hypothetical protein